MTGAPAQLPRLLAITSADVDADPAGALRGLLRAAAPGTVAVVLRDRQLDARRRFELGLELRDLCAFTEQALWVSERLDLARLLAASGLHLPGNGLLPSQCGAFSGTLSRALHQGEDLADAELLRLDALLLSPAMAPRKGRPALGTSGLSALIRQLSRRAPRLAYYALGGVEPDNVPALLRSGVAGVAAIGAAHAADPKPLLSALGCLR